MLIAMFIAIAVSPVDLVLWPKAAMALPMVWRVERQVDDSTGQKTCAIISIGGNVVVRLAGGNAVRMANWSVQVGYDNQPGSLRYLRVNRETFQTAEPEFRGTEAAEIVSLLKGPGEFAFEWASQPDFAKRQGLFGTGDFAERAIDCETWVGGERVYGPGFDSRARAVTPETASAVIRGPDSLAG